MRGFDVDGELGFLKDSEFIDIVPPEDERMCAQITFPFRHGPDGFLVDLCQFIEKTPTLRISQVIGNNDFTGF